MGRRSVKKRPGVEDRGTSIRIGFTYNREYCRETMHIQPTEKNLNYAERKRIEILNQIERGTFDYASTFPNSPRAKKYRRGDGVLLRDYLSTWLDRVKPTVSASTYRDYKHTVLNQLVPAFGHLPVASLARTVVRDWAAATTCTNKRIANILSPLRQALTDAVDDELITANPLKGWRYRRREAPRPQDDVDPFSQDEQTAILAQLEGQGRNLIQFAFWTGMRTSEIVGLEWGDVDWIRGVVVISRGMTQAAEVAELPKTSQSRREVKMLEPARAALEAQKAHTFLAGGQIFHNPRTREPWTGDQAIRKTLWTHALKRAGVRYRRPYQTRHTFASMMLSAGEDPWWVASQMGHRDLAMLERRYGRYMPQAGDQSGNKAVKAFSDCPDTSRGSGKVHG